jgi:hypothetical protein
MFTEMIGFVHRVVSFDYLFIYLFILIIFNYFLKNLQVGPLARIPGINEHYIVIVLGGLCNIFTKVLL